MRACTRVCLSQGKEGRGKSATPRGRNHQATPPRPSGGGVRGPKGPPLSPPPPQAQERTEADQRDSGPAPPRGGRCTRGGGGAPRPRQAPPVNRLHTPALPATGRRRTGGAQDGANGAARSEAGLGKAGARTRARRSLPPSLHPPPPAALTHWRPTGPRPTPAAARQPPQHE